MLPRCLMLLSLLAAALLSSGSFRPATAAAAARASDEGADDPKKPTVEILGLRVLERDAVRRMAGPGPRSCGDRAAWAERAVRRIVRELRKRGYRYARAWYDTPEPCAVRLEVDEGRMHRVVFVGVSAYRTFLMRVDVNLPNDVFHGPTLERAMRELKLKHDLLNAYHRVVEVGLDAETELERFNAPQRALKIFVVTRESFGWTLDVDLDSQWGVVPDVGFTFRDVLLTDDRVHAELALALPYREYAFQEDPAFQWVHGRLETAYRFPPFWEQHVAPQLGVATELSQYHREDIGLERFYLVRTEAALGARLLFPPDFEMSLGGGIDHAHVFLVDYEDQGGEGDGPPAPEQSLLRYAALLDAELVLDPEALRRDQRDRIDLSLRFASAGPGDWLLDSQLSSQVWFHLGLHDLVIAARALYVTGDVRFWDEENLAGSYQRVWFDNRYWVREAFQLVTAARFAVWEDTVKIGVFHDGSIFGDRSGSDLRVGLANAFGPSLHWLFFDLLAFDLYYGFGFDRHGFDHALSFELRTVF